MRSKFAILTTVVGAILAVVAAPPQTGYLKDYGYARYVFPFTVAQCEPFYIFYNVTVPVNPFTFSHSNTLFLIHPPIGVGYLEWICNIPAGFTFYVDFPLNYVVQPGSSSACLKDVTTTYPLLTYSTAAFASYTRTASPTSSPTFTNIVPIASFPTGALSTITLNSDLAVAAPTPPPTPTPPIPSPSPTPPSSSLPTSSPPTTSPSPTPPAPPPSPTPTPKPLSSSVIGGIVGAVAFVLLVLALIFVLWWRRERSVPARTSSPIDPQPAFVSGLSTSEVGSSPLPSPFQYPATRQSGPEFYGNTPQYPFSPYDGMSDGSAIGSPVSSSPTSPDRVLSFARTSAFQSPPGDVQGSYQQMPPFSPFTGQRPSQGAFLPIGAGHALLPQPSRESPDGYQRPLPSPPPSSASRASPTTDRQAPYTFSMDSPSNTEPTTSLPDIMPSFQQSSMSGTQDGNLDLPSVLRVISRAPLSPRERKVITSFNNLLIQTPPAPPDPVVQDSTFSPPPYSA